MPRASYGEGQWAHYYGRQENPYPAGSEAHAEWQRGYDNAAADAEYNDRMAEFRFELTYCRDDGE